MRLLTRDKSFYKSLLLLAIPIALQNSITFAVNFADNIMIGTLGDDAISGVYVCTTLQSVMQMMIGGVEQALLILGAQYWGKKDTLSVKRLSTIALRFSFFVGLAMTTATFLFPAGIIV